jgi:hypothetical protein
MYPNEKLIQGRNDFPYIDQAFEILAQMAWENEAQYQEILANCETLDQFKEYFLVEASNRPSRHTQL